MPRINGKRLAQERERKDWNKAQLAARVGVVSRSIERYEAGGCTGERTLEGLANALDVNKQDLVERVDLSFLPKLQELCRGVAGLMQKCGYGHVRVSQALSELRREFRKANAPQRTFCTTGQSASWRSIRDNSRQPSRNWSGLATYVHKSNRSGLLRLQDLTRRYHVWFTRPWH